jgi:predicted Zn-dependent protease with MMP-like domain
VHEIPPEEFDRLVEEAVAALPPEFARMLDNVAIVVEEEPTEEDLELLDDDYIDDGDDDDDDEDDEELIDVDDDEPDELLGIYRGIALPDRSFGMPPTLPDQIAIFRGPILRISRSRREAIREIRETVIHELGHYFGLDDHDMPF